jgi:hypothetical protein
LSAPPASGTAPGPGPRSDNARPITNAQLVEALCEVSIPLREARRVHVAAYGLLIPHVFMSDVLARVGECLAAARADGSVVHAAEVESIMGALERGLAEGERETRNVIALSFARDSEFESFFEQLRLLMGPRTRAQLQGR